MLSRLDFDIPITTAFVLLAIFLNLSIFGSRLLMFKLIRCSPLLVKSFSLQNNYFYTILDANTLKKEET